MKQPTIKWNGYVIVGKEWVKHTRIIKCNEHLFWYSNFIMKYRKINNCGIKIENSNSAIFLQIVIN